MEWEWVGRERRQATLAALRYLPPLKEKRERLETFYKLLPECQVQHLALTVLCVPPSPRCSTSYLVHRPFATSWVCVCDGSAMSMDEVGVGGVELPPGHPRRAAVPPPLPE